MSDIGYDARPLDAATKRFRFTGDVAALAQDDVATLFDRSTSSDAAIRDRTREIIDRVRRDGDQALRALSVELDGVSLDDIEIPRARWDEALERIPAALRRALERAAANIDAVHRAFLPQTIETSPEPGIVIGRRADPLGAVGIYAPGGRAAYPSSVLMGAVPARVAGVGTVILCSPPNAGSGMPSDVVLAAAALAGVDRLFAVGGAGAIAALAYGTASIPRVDRVIGPGNAYVAEAKLQVAGAVGIDAPAGPSELLVLADSGADADVIAHELLGQAEHDPLACAVAVIFPARGEDMDDARRAADRLTAALDARIDTQERRSIVAVSLATRGGVLVAADRAAAVAFANAYAPEHLIVAAGDPDSVLADVRNAGTVFVGATSSNAFGDYMTGANHVLPTGGLARSYSGLSVLDFVRWTTYQRVSADAAAGLADDVATIALAEGLPGHAAAALQWREARREESA